MRLIGHPLSILDTEHYNQLQLLVKHYVVCFLIKKNKLLVSCSNTINEVCLLWQVTNIPTTQKPTFGAKFETKSITNLSELLKIGLDE